MTLTTEEVDLLGQLSDTEWCSVGYRIGPYRPWQAATLARAGLAEKRERKPGAYEYRRTEAGTGALDEMAPGIPV